MKKISNRLVIVLLSIFLMGGTFTSCKKSATVAPPDPIGGFNNSNEIQAANLKAHWTFDGTANEAISNTAPTTSVGSSFGTGVKGQAVNFTNGYFVYPNIAALNGPDFGAITVSCWVKVTNNLVLGAGGTPMNAFSLTQGASKQSDWNVGSVNMLIETGAYQATSDSLRLHPSFASFKNGGYSFGDNINTGDAAKAGIDYQIVHGNNKWTHYVFRYDGTASNADIFANGVLVSNSNYRQRGTFGHILTAGGATQAIIGGFANASTGFPNSSTQPFEQPFNGSIDELRFYTTTLTDAEISALYQLELVGR